MCQLFGEGIQNDRIQAILEANVVPRLVSLLRPLKSRSVPSSVQLAALQVLGNVACGDDRQTQVVIDSDALPCLRSLLSSSDRQIRKEVCWIVSNITESSHQVQDVLDADILPPLLKLLDNQDSACREDATWVLFNLSSNRDPRQISYLANKNGVRALCNLLTCQKDLDVLWKGCGTVAAVALKGLRNILISGQLSSSADPSGYNKMVSLVAEAHGVERIEALTSHVSPDVRRRAHLILERIFGAEHATTDYSPMLLHSTVSALQSFSTPPLPLSVHSSCSCDVPRNSTQLEVHHEPHHQPQSFAHCHGHNTYNVAGGFLTESCSSPATANACFGHANADGPCTQHSHSEADLRDVPGSTSGSSSDSEHDDEDSDSELIPPPPEPCKCLLCTDSSPLPERRPRVRNAVEEVDHLGKVGSSYTPMRTVCEFCAGCGRLGDGRAGLAAKLGRAVRLGHSHCLALLLSRMTWSQRGAATEAPALLHPGGGPPDAGVGNSLPAVVLSAQLGKPNCLSLLLARCLPDLDTTYGRKRLTALAWASHKGYLRCSQLLLEHGANPAVRCGDGVTALHLASSGGGHTSICKLLIEYKAPVNALSVKKQTPLCLAAQKGFSGVVQLLLDHGADPNNEDEGKYTPLHLASSNGYSETVEILLRHGARAEAKTRNDVTPLHYAVQSGHPAVVSSLIKAGANVNCDKKPLLLIAADDGKQDIVRLLLESGASVNCRANIRATLDKDMEVCDYLTPLHLAASKNHHEVVELLLRGGADVNELTSKSGWSSLDFAVLNGNTQSALLLLQRGAVVSDTCKTLGRNNWTLVQYAASNGAKDVVRLLIQRLKEQGAESSTGDANSSASLYRAMSASTDAPGSISQTQNSNGLLRASYAVGENYHTCSTCSKLRHSGCFTRTSQKTYRGGVPDTRNETRSVQKMGSPGEIYGSATVFDAAGRVDGKVQSTSSRQRIDPDDRQGRLRAREIRKREAEALDARDRLQEAISQRSVPKLTEAISHVNKLVLHLATAVSSEGVSSHPDYSEFSDSNQVESCGHAGYVPSPLQRTPTNASVSSLVTAPLAMEMGLGNEVQKARKILASLLAEEKKAREEKEREAMDSRRENAHRTVKKAIAAASEGGDPRSLTRAVNRATRNILEHDDPVILRAVNLLSLISGLEKCDQGLRNARREGNLRLLSSSVSDARRILEDLKKEGGVGAATRVFHGKQPSDTLTEAQLALNALREKRKTEEAQKLEAMRQEQKANTELKDAISSNDLLLLERSLTRASGAVLSKESELASTVDIARRVMAKRLKTERRKLRQAINDNDPKKIEEAATKAEGFGLNALRPDIASAMEQAQKLREQAAAVNELNAALSCSDVNALGFLRARLISLGLFSEAEKARSQLERIQRETRARALLEHVLKDSKERSDYIQLLLTTSTPTDPVLERAASWAWPDVKRLRDLSNRTRRYGASGIALCEAADKLCERIADLGGQILELCTESKDARSIAAVITGYENAFDNIPRAAEMGSLARTKVLKRAKEHLAHVQAIDQASIKAESAQVKVEYALATSRRSAARMRLGRAGHGSRNIENSTTRSLSSETTLVESPLLVPSSIPSVLADDSFEHETFVTLISPGENHRMSRATIMPRTDQSKEIKDGAHHPCGEDLRTHQNSTALHGECSHFYLFREGNTVVCSRCGNLRSSGNPEWLARVKRRESKILPTENAAEPSDNQAELRHQSCHGNGVSQHRLRSGPPSTRDKGSQRDLCTLVSASSVPASNGVSSRQVVRNSGPSTERSARTARLSSYRPNVSGLVHVFQEEESIQVSGINQSHPQQSSAEEQSLMSKTTMPLCIPNAYHTDLNRRNATYHAGMQGRGSHSVSTTYLPSDLTAVPLPLCGLGQTVVPTCHGQNSSLSGQDALGIATGVTPRSQIEAEKFRVQSASSRPKCHAGGVDTGLGRHIYAEDIAYGGRDLGRDFANENFGFDIDTIVDEPPPARGKSNPISGSESNMDDCLSRESSHLSSVRFFHN